MAALAPARRDRLESRGGPAPSRRPGTGRRDKGMGAMGGSSTETSTTSQILAWAAASYRTVSIDGTTFYDLTQPLAAS